jgi:hypothetical protein
MQQVTDYSHSKTLRALAMLTAVLLFTAVAATTTHALPPHNVELVSFTATALSNGVRLSWETATEFETAGYILQREEEGEFVDLLELYDANGQPYQDGIIDAMGSPTVGAIYVADDRTAVSGQTYTYQLVEIEANSNLIAIGDVTITAGQTTPTATLIPVGNNTPVGGSQNTPTPTNTIPATATTHPAATTAATATTVRTFVTATPASAANQETETGQAQATAVPVNNTNPPSNSNPQPAPPANTDGIAFAQELETPASAYPGNTTAPEAENGYPEGLATALPLDSTASPYPVGSFPEAGNPTPTIIAVIGSQTETTESDTAVDSSINSQSGSPSSTAVLWLGFLVGSIIFAAAIYGSIRLFARRRS